MKDRSSSLQLAIHVAGFLMIFGGIASIISVVFTLGTSFGTFHVVFGRMINEGNEYKEFYQKMLLTSSVAGGIGKGIFKILIGYLAIKFDGWILKKLGYNKALGVNSEPLRSSESTS